MLLGDDTLWISESLFLLLQVSQLMWDNSKQLYAAAEGDEGIQVHVRIPL